MTFPPGAQSPGYTTIYRKDRIMNVETINQISASERARRRREVDFARGNIRHDGGILSEEIERLNARYVAGEIDSDELTAAILRSQTVKP